ncbi:MAG: hypothetical protein ACLRP3_22215 [Escherichia sp.]
MCYNINMFLVGIFQWWYGNGLLQYIRQSFLGVLRTADFFSVGLLLKTLFNPFRQISVAPVGGDLSVQLSAFFDKMFSRAIGAVVRSMVIIIGILMILLRFLWMIVGIIMWLALPLMPFIGIILWQMGVSVWK